MKLLISLALVLVSLSVTYGKRCASEDDCEDGKCCVALLAGHMRTKGLCLRLNRLGAKCSEPDSKNEYYGGKYMNYCPCQEGMSCKPKGLRPGVTDRPTVLTRLRCQKEDATTPSPTTVAPSSTVQPEPDVKEPEPDVKEPEPDVKEPEPDVKEPEPDVKEPEPDVKEPEPDVKEPEPDVKEPEPDVDEPEPDVEG